MFEEAITFNFDFLDSKMLYGTLIILRYYLEDSQYL